MSDIRTGFEVYTKLTKLGLISGEERKISKSYTVKKKTIYRPWGNEVEFQIYKANEVTRPLRINYSENANGIEKLTLYPAPNININKIISKL